MNSLVLVSQEDVCSVSLSTKKFELSSVRHDKKVEMVNFTVVMTKTIKMNGILHLAVFY